MALLTLLVTICIAYVASAMHPLDGSRRSTSARDNTLYDAVKNPVDYGVQHLFLNGPMQLLDNSTVGVDAVIYFKALRISGNRTRFRAQVYLLDPARVSLHQGRWMHFNPPADWYFHRTLPKRYYLRPASLGIIQKDSFEFKIYPIRNLLSPSGGTHPITLTLDLKNEIADAYDEFFFCIDDWLHTGLVVKSLLTSWDSDWMDPENDSHPWSVYTVFTPFFGISTRLASFVLTANTAYHVGAMGFNGTLLYERGNYLPHLARDRHVAALAAAGHLEVMLWNQMSANIPMVQEYPERAYESAPIQKYDQHVVYNHAIMSLYGRKSYLYFVDFDEYLYLPEGINMRQIIQGECNNGKQPAYIGLSRFNYICGREQDFLDLKEKDMSSIIETLQLLPNCRRRNVESVIGKGLAYADKMAGYWTHQGTTFEWTGKDEVVRDPCGAHIVHLNDLVNPHWTRRQKGHTTADDSWLWAVEEAMRHWHDKEKDIASKIRINT